MAYYSVMRWPLLILLLAVQDAPKTEFRNAFKKGDAYNLFFNVRLRVTIEEIPEEFQEIFPDEPVDVRSKGEASLLVTNVADDGTATFEGKMQILSAGGVFFLADVAFDYDRGRDGEKIKGGDSPEGAGAFGFSTAQTLKALALDKVKFTVDRMNKVAVTAKGAARGYSDRIFDLAGLTGGLSKEKVGPGDSWKGTGTMQIPNLPILIRVAAVNTYEKAGDLGGAPCAVLKSTFDLSSEAAKEVPAARKEKRDQEKPPDEEEPGRRRTPLDELKGKIEGQGDGTLLFGVDPARPLKHEARLKLKATLRVPHPAGGDEIVVRVKIVFSQGFELKKP